MGLFDRFRKKRQLTPEEQKKLSLITSPVQRAAILSALEAGEEVPHYAWTPVSDDMIDRIKSMPNYDKIIELMNREAASQGRSFSDTLGDADHTWKYNKAYEELAPHLKPGKSLLSPPIEIEPPLLRCEDSRLLATWAYFNPFGPTICVLTLDRPSKMDDYLIVFGVGHPFLPWYCVYGVCRPDLVNNRDRLLNLLSALFTRNGTDSRPMFGGYPTHFQFGDDTLLSKDELRELVFLSAKKLDCRDLPDFCDGARRYYGDPWERTRIEFQGALRSSAATIKHSMESTDFVPASRNLLERWWSVVTDPEHVEAERRELPNAWRGAIEFQRDPKSFL